METITKYKDLDTLLDEIMIIQEKYIPFTNKERVPITLEISQKEANLFQDNIMVYSQLFTPRTESEKIDASNGALYMGPQGIKVTLKIKEDVI